MKTQNDKASSAHHDSSKQPPLEPQHETCKPADLDLERNPHYSVQSVIYSLLLSALNMSEHYEKCPGAEERQELLDGIVRVYQDTLEPLNIKP